MPSIDADALERTAAALLEAIGLPPEPAGAVAESLVAADLRGHPSHGVHMIPRYAAWIDAGGMDPTAEPSVVHDGGATLLFDGNDAPGHYVGQRATARAIERVPDRGVVTVAVRRATHMGRIGWFAEQAAEAGYGFIGFTNMSSGEPVAVAGSAERRFGTNPITAALPAFDALDHPFLLDMATTQVAFGKINVRETAGRPIDDSWTITEDGGSVPDAAAFNEDELGALAPLGGQDAGYKGTGLMLAAELFAATLSDSPVTPQPDSRYANSAVFTLFDPLDFTTREAHEARLRALAEYLDEIEYPDAVSPGDATDADRAQLPGRQEHERKTEYEDDGIPVPEEVAAALLSVGEDYDVDPAVLDPLSVE
jgi:uncharacterized oxidoreductase